MLCKTFMLHHVTTVLLLAYTGELITPALIQ